MNEPNLNTTQVPVTPPQPLAPVPTPVKPKVADLVKEIFRKFRENKKLFRIVAVLFVTLFLTIVVGLIFSVLKRNGNLGSSSSPTPQATTVAEAGEVDKNAESLKDLKEKIINLDIHQKRLTPPSVNFDISF